MKSLDVRLELDLQTIDEKCSDESISMKRLWQKVIYQAFVDAVSNSRKKKEQIRKMIAREWLLNADDTFYDVCMRAGLEPLLIKRNVDPV